MNEKFLRLLAGQQYLIDLTWGYQRLLEIDAMSEMSGGNADFFAQAKAQSQQVDFFVNNQLSNLTYDELPNNAIAKVSLSGVMTLEDGLCHYGLKSFDRTMRQLYADDRIKGIVLDIDSGGGQAGAGALMFNTIADKNKPVITHFGLLASAAVLGTLKSDEIIAQGAMSRAGSIGVMLSFPKWYADKDDERNQTTSVYSRTSERKNEEFRALERGDLSKLEDMLTILDKTFMDTVKANRKLKGSKSYQDETLSGAMFPANLAKRRGIIDGIGSWNYVMKRMDSALRYY